jgi:hypothetical protein
LSELTVIVSLTLVKACYSGIVYTGAEFLCSINNTSEEFLNVVTVTAVQSKTVKASLNSIVDTSEKFLTNVKNTGNASSSGVIATSKAPKSSNNTEYSRKKLKLILGLSFRTRRSCL